MTKQNSSDTKRSKKKISVKADNTPSVDPTKLQAQLMTDEQYQDQIDKVQKSLPEFDVEKDCPPAFKKPVKKKKSGFMSFLEKIF